MAHSGAAPRSCKEDADLAKSLVLKPLRMRHHHLTGGMWMSGHGAQKEDESTEEEVVHQISVLHEDSFVRTYTVSDAEFHLVGDCDLDSLEPDPHRAQCFIDKQAEKISRKEIDERMNTRKYKGGCEEGQKMIAEKQELKDMTGTRIQYWDTTQADWYAGRIAGMWLEKPITHFLCEIDDDTEYAVDYQQDSWRLEPGASSVVPFNQYKCGGFGRLLQLNGKSEVLEFIVLTSAPRNRLYVYTSKYSIRVHKEGRSEKVSAGELADDTASSDEESELRSDGADRENIPAEEQVASGSDGQRERKSHSRWWSASSDRPLNTSKVQIEHVKKNGKNAALRVLVHMEAGEQSKGASVKPTRRRPAASKRI